VALQEHWNTLAPILHSPLTARLGYINQRRFYTSLLDAKNGNLGRYFLRLIRALSWELWLRDVIAREIVVGPEPSTDLRKAWREGTRPLQT
jgi:hypothetical protein